MTSWTDERTKLLEARWAEEASASEIGAELGISRCAVLGKAFRLGLERRESGRRFVVREKRQRRTAKAPAPVAPCRQTPSPPRRFSWEQP